MTIDAHTTAEVILNIVEHEDKSIEVKLSVQEKTVLTQVLESIFSAVRAGRVDEVRELTGISDMTMAAHLITIRNSLKKA